MSNATIQPELPPAVKRVLDAVRLRIRTYVWVEGLALVVVTLGVAFWLGLGLDWSFELPPSVRRVAMVAVAAAMVWVAYRHLLRRVIVPITDSSAALLLERRFPALGEHVLTAVAVASSPDRAAGLDRRLVEQTNQAAAHAVANIEPGKLFNRGPLIRAVGAAIGLAVSIALFAVLASNAFGFWLERLALSERSWPRRVQLEVVGFPPDANGVRVQKLAQDDDYEMLVHAQTEGHEVPESVEIRYTLSDGRRGRDTMIRVGGARPGPDEFQLFRYEFKRVAGDMTFDVIGGDYRVRDLTLRVVDRPELYAIELECIYPVYLGREPRQLPVTGGMRVPEGSRLVIHAAATKPLTSARIHRLQNQANTDVTFGDQPADKLQWDYGTLSTDDVLLVSVTDVDDVTAREPYRISITAVPDEVPQVAVRLAGISTAVTPDATIPFAGKVTDDYGLETAWFEYQVDVEPKRVRPLAVQPAGRQTLKELGSFDLRGSDDRGGPRTLTLQPGSKLTLLVQASDRYDLADEVRAGSSQPFSLDVVTAGQLLALIERRELALRQRYQAIYDKLTDTRNLLGRVEFGEASNSEGNTKDASTGDDEADAAPAAAAQREVARRRLRVAGALQNIVQSGEEVRGVAEAFDDLHDQLVNNRIDNRDLKSRLREQIAEPLHRIGNERMPQLAAQAKLVEDHVEDAKAGQAELTKSLTLADVILVEMQRVLDRMKELENYNEAVALLRGIISDQEEINRQTKERQRERLNTLLED